MKKWTAFLSNLMMWFICPVALAGWMSWSVLMYWDSNHTLFDSGWVSADNKQDRTITIKHSLPSAPTEVTMWFSPSPNGEPEYLLNWSWSADLSGNPVTIAANRSSVTLNIYKGVPLHGVWDPLSGWHQFSAGYFRVIAR
ncbi:hypothetical protein [Bradyrhizobium sp. CCBAU 53340]|uniref:hypothetical protein n=1 Tax=Bradyrhizobium sp. CCBAU 53340 TaxID=1325112 RepID=UPI00188D7D53|nr:hypothetical protein [Bradyrhizobium sp. CCBAU 53340]